MIVEITYIYIHKPREGLFVVGGDVIINIKEAAPSLGKTYGAALHIKSNDEKYIIYF